MPNPTFGIKNGKSLSTMRYSLPKSKFHSWCQFWHQIWRLPNLARKVWGRWFQRVRKAVTPKWPFSGGTNLPHFAKLHCSQPKKWPGNAILAPTTWKRNMVMLLEPLCIKIVLAKASSAKHQRVLFEDNLIMCSVEISIYTDMCRTGRCKSLACRISSDSE